MLIFRVVLILMVVALTQTLLAQKIEINLGPDEVNQNEPWQVILTVYNAQLKSYDKFPDIKGFRKGGQSTRFYTTDINGKTSSIQSVILNYLPQKPGTVTVPAFSMKVNNSLVRVQGKQVRVKPSVLQQSNPNAYNRKPSDFFGQDEPDYVEIRDEAFLALTTDKKEVYVGEGVGATLAFYIPEFNTATIRWHDLSRQLTEILKKIKPSNCWEENFDIENVEGEQVTINGRQYIQWKIYQAMFYPFNAQPIQFPSVGLEMIKLREARNPSYFRPNNQESFKTFYSKPVTITVKDLPPHPLKNSVGVGEFRLDERIMNTDLKTGQSAAYEFNIYGEGNIASLEKPRVKTDGEFEIYDPSSNQEISRNRNRIVGTKSFRYFMIPKEPGQFKLKPYFEWIFFSPSRKAYDTLTSNLTVYVTGESRKNEEIDSQDPGNIYETIDHADNELKVVTGNRWEKWAFNGFLILIVAASGILLFKK